MTYATPAQQGGPKVTVAMPLAETSLQAAA